MGAGHFPPGPIRGQAVSEATVGGSWRDELSGYEKDTESRNYQEPDINTSVLKVIHSCKGCFKEGFGRTCFSGLIVNYETMKSPHG